VTAGEQGDQQFLDHPVLADDDLAQVRPDAIVGPAKLGHRRQIIDPDGGVLSILL
jgi:hypothetical protein